MPIPPINLGGNITTGQGPQLPSATGPMVPSNGNWFSQNAPSGGPWNNNQATDQGPYGWNGWWQRQQSGQANQPQQQPGGGFQFDPSQANNPDYQKQFVDDRVMATQGRHATDQDYAYWLPKFAAAGGLGDGSFWYARMTDPQGTGSNAGEGGGAFGGGGAGGQSLQGLLGLNPGYGIFKNLSGGMTPQQILQANPGYQFAEQRGLNAIDTGAAAKGTLLTGGNQRDRADFASGLASGNWNNIFGQQLGLAGLGSGIYQNQVGNNLNLAQLGKPS